MRQGPGRVSHDRSLAWEASGALCPRATKDFLP